MSYIYEFVNYYQAKSGAALHTISEIESDLDPEKISGYEFYTIEPQKLEITCYLDSWLTANLLIGIKALNNNTIGNTRFWNKCIRIKKDGEIIYIGYIRADGYDPDLVANEITITAMNSVGFLIETFENDKITYNVEEEYPFEAELRRLLLGNQVLSTEAYQPPEFSIHENYNMISGWYWNSEIDEGSFSEWDYDHQLFPTGYPAYSPVLYLKKSIQAIYEDEEGIVNVVFCKFWQGTIMPTRVAEYIKIRHFKIKNSIILYEDNTFTHHKNWYFVAGVEIEEYQNQVEADELYWTHYLGNGYPHLQNLGPYETQAGIYQIIGDDLKFTGVVNFDHFIFKRQRDDEDTVELKRIDILRKLLLLNNLTMKPIPDSDIHIVNRTNVDEDLPVLYIPDQYIQEDNPIPILKDPPDFENEYDAFENGEYIGRVLTGYMEYIYDLMDEGRLLEIEKVPGLIEKISICQLLVCSHPAGGSRQYKVVKVQETDEGIFVVEAWRDVEL